MSELSRETLTAFADGELAPQEMTRVAALVAQSGDLQAFVAQQQAVRDELAKAFAPALVQPVPQRLLDAAATAPVSRRFGAAVRTTAFKDFLLRLAPLRVTGPAALALALGLVIGVAIERPTSLTPFAVPSSGTMVAQGELAQALSNRLASQGEGGDTRIGISFRNLSGQDCRTFEMRSGAASTSGVACRTKDAWAIAALASAPRDANAGADYQMAGAAMPQAIRSAVAAMIVGAPFDAAREQQARSRNWQGNSNR